MTIKSSGTWARGTVHTIIDDKPRQPGPKEVMNFFLRMGEIQLLDALAAEVDAGTLSLEKAESIMKGYIVKKPTYSAYK